MFENDYLLKLRKYIGKEVNISDNENETWIYADTEIQYILRKNEQQYILFMEERGSKSVISTFQTEIEMKRKFSLWMKSFLGNSIEYPYTDKFKDIENILLLKELIYQYSDHELYSIDDEKEDRIILTKNKDNSYNIYFLDRNGKKYIFEQNQEPPFIFKRFYKEVVFYGEMTERIRKYELFFEDKLDYNEKIQLLGY